MTSSVKHQVVHSQLDNVIVEVPESAPCHEVNDQRQLHKDEEDPDVEEHVPAKAVPSDTADKQSVKTAMVESGALRRSPSSSSGDRAQLGGTDAEITGALSDARISHDVNSEERRERSLRVKSMSSAKRKQATEPNLPSSGPDRNPPHLGRSVKAARFSLEKSSEDHSQTIHAPRSVKKPVPSDRKSVTARSRVNSNEDQADQELPIAPRTRKRSHSQGISEENTAKRSKQTKVAHAGQAKIGGSQENEIMMVGLSLLEIKLMTSQRLDEISIVRVSALTIEDWD